MGCRSKAKRISQCQNACTPVTVSWVPQGLSKSRTVSGLPAPCRSPLIPPVLLLPPAAPKAITLPAPHRIGRAAQSRGQKHTPSLLQAIAGNEGAAVFSHTTTMTPAASLPLTSCASVTLLHLQTQVPLCREHPFSLLYIDQPLAGFTLLLPQVPPKPLSNN